MKKLVCLLALCLALNGTSALASDLEETAAQVEPAQAEAAQAEAAQDEVAQAEAAAGQAPADGEVPENKEPQADEAVQTPEDGGTQDAEIVDGQPSESVEGQPSEPAEGQPSESAEGQPSEPVEGQPSEPVVPAPEAQSEDAVSGEAPADGQDAESADGPEAPATEARPGEEAPAPEGEPAAGEAASGDGAAEAEPQPAEDGAAVAAEEIAVPEDAQCWFERDGARIGGRLEEILPMLVGGEALNLLTKNLQGVVRVQDVALKPLATVKLLPDDAALLARVSRSDPAGAESPEVIELSDLADCADDARGDLYIWLEPVKQPEPEPAPTEEPAPVIGVRAENLSAGTWTAELPTFTLSGIPEGKAYSYAAIIYDERIVPLSGDTFTPSAEGQYDVRFAMLDGIGDIVSASDTYRLLLDLTPPESVTIAQDEAVSYTMHITAKDAVSGLAGVSLDGGATWTPMADGEEFIYTGANAEVFSVGAIQVMDCAGNIWRSKAEVTLEAVAPEGGYGGGGGGGGSGESKPAPSHASGDGEESAEYATLELELPEEPMKRLTLGGEAMALTLVLDSAQAEGAPVGEEQPFTASLARWRAPDSETDPHENVLAEAEADAANTLVLAAEPEDLGDAFTYTWRFNGEVCRMLANSGIRYVALKVGDDVAAFPAEGFTGGTKYTELKMLGVSTRKFDYTLTMRVNLDPGYMSAMSDCDFSRSCDLSIRAEVENMAYELSPSANSLMYFYDVYLGPEAMLAQPFGQYKSE